MKAQNIGINYWLNTRQGFYDHRVLFRLKGRAFKNYIDQAEQRYQEAKARELKQMHEQAEASIRRLDDEIKSYLRSHLWPTVLKFAKGDLRRAAELLKEPTYQKLIDQYDLRTELHAKYRAEQPRQREQGC